MRVAALLLLTVSALLAAAAAPAADSRRALADELAAAHRLDPDRVAAVLAGAKYQQGIIDAISRPAEAKPWKAYRPIFMTEKRINDGRAFLAQHREALAKVEADTGVPAEMIVAIIGVETSYGRITGSYRVIDALYTLGAHYPPRQTFFRSELGHLFALAEEEQLDIPALKGSYAGAMGLGQFMPSSYRAYAVDGDGDGRRDLFGSLPDVFASIANYFVAHGWKPGQPVAVPALLDGEAFSPGSLEARFDLAELGERGYRPRDPLDVDLPATVLNLEGEGGAEHWIAFQNFYVISRYNRSQLYSLAVYQLSRSLVHGAADPVSIAP
jgi:membrane-bound lytic murein transglycosylase B